MDFFEFQDCLKRVAYKPGWVFNAKKYNDQLIEFTLGGLFLSDVTAMERPAQLLSKKYLTIDRLKDLDEQDVVRLCAGHMLWFEMHEMAEWLKYELISVLEIGEDHAPINMQNAELFARAYQDWRELNDYADMVYRFRRKGMRNLKIDIEIPLPQGEME